MIVINNQKVKQEKKKLNKYFIFFVVTTVGSMYISDESQLGTIFSFLALVSLVLLIVKSLEYKRNIKGIK